MPATTCACKPWLSRNGGLAPAAGASHVPLPKTLAWDALPGARYYMVYLFDMWEDGRQIHESKLHSEARLNLPEGLLKPGGAYLRRVHARDINEDPKLGAFNHGSLTGDIEFSVADTR